MMTTDVYPGKDLGTLELTITDEMVQHRIVWPNEPFTTRGMITGRRVEGSRTCAEVTVFCEKAVH
jgi:hypothetical protein